MAIYKHNEPIPNEPSFLKVYINWIFYMNEFDLYDDYLERHRSILRTMVMKATFNKNTGTLLLSWDDFLEGATEQEKHDIYSPLVGLSWSDLIWGENEGLALNPTWFGTVEWKHVSRVEIEHMFSFEPCTAITITYDTGDTYCSIF